VLLLLLLMEVVTTSNLEAGVPPPLAHGGRHCLRSTAHQRSLLRYSPLSFLRWVGRRLPSFLLLGVVFVQGRRREVEYFYNLILPTEYFGNLIL
jgi:hypothetical protein